MVYSKLDTVLCGHLPAGKIVTINLINPKTDLVLTTVTNLCNESQNQSGLYYFNVENINDASIEDLTSNLEIVYVMSDETGASYGGKIVISKDYDKLEEQIGIVKGVLDSVPDNIFDADIATNIDYRTLLMTIKQNTDLILV